MNLSKSAKNWLQYASIPLARPTNVTNCRQLLPMCTLLQSLLFNVSCTLPQSFTLLVCEVKINILFLIILFSWLLVALLIISSLFIYYSYAWLEFLIHDYPCARQCNSIDVVCWFNENLLYKLHRNNNVVNYLCVYRNVIILYVLARLHYTVETLHYWHQWDCIKCTV